MKITNRMKSGLASLALAGALLGGAACSNSNPAIPAGSYTGIVAINATFPTTSATSVGPKATEPEFIGAAMLQVKVSDSGNVNGAITLFDSAFEGPHSVGDFPNPALFGHTYLISGDATADGFSFDSDVSLEGSDFSLSGTAAFNADSTISGTISANVSDGPELSGDFLAIPDGPKMSVACGGFGFSGPKGGADGFAGFIMQDKNYYALFTSPDYTGTAKLSYDSADFSGCSSVDCGSAEGTGSVTGTADIPVGEPGTGFSGDLPFDAEFGIEQEQDYDWLTTFTWFGISGNLNSVDPQFNGGFGGSTDSCMDGEIVTDWWID